MVQWLVMSPYSKVQFQAKAFFVWSLQFKYDLISNRFASEMNIHKS